MSAPAMCPDAPADVELSVLVVSYGTRDMTLECLGSVLRETRDTSYEVLVVDNASSDDSAKAVAERFPAFRVLPQSRNLGFAAACNLAGQLAKGRYFLLLNPDTVVLDGAIDRLVSFARRRPAAGIWGGRMLFGDGTLNPMSCSRRQTFWNLFCSVSGLTTLFPNSPLFHSQMYGGWRRDTEREVDIVSGGFLLIDGTVWQRLGGFAPEFFMYGEDADLCLRARQIGFEPAITPEATVVHHGSGTERDKVRKIAQVLTARTLLIRRHFSPVARPLALALLALIPLLGQLTGRGAEPTTWRQVWGLRHRWLAGKY